MNLSDTEFENGSLEEKRTKYQQIKTALKNLTSSKNELLENTKKEIDHINIQQSKEIEDIKRAKQLEIDTIKAQYEHDLQLMKTQKTIENHNSRQNQIIGDRFNKYGAKPVQCQTKNRERSPTGLSLKHSEELCEAVNNFVKTDNDIIKKKQISRVNEIMKTQHLEDLHNQHHIIRNDLVIPSFVNVGDYTYNSDKVFEKQRIIKFQVQNMGSLSFEDFINQFKYFDIKEFSEIEYNMIVFMNLDTDTKAKLDEIGINVLTASTIDFLIGIQDIMLGGSKSITELEKEFSEYKSKSTNINTIISEHNKLIRAFPSKYYKEKEKHRKLISSLRQYLPYYLQALLQEKEQTTVEGILTITAFRAFVTTHNGQINHFLKQKRTFVKNINEKKERKLEQKYLKLATNSNIISSDDDEDINDQITESLQLNEEDFRSEDEFVNKIETAKVTKSCSICKTYYHNTLECIFNPNDKIRNLNIARLKIKVCLLCKQKNHSTQKCDIFVNSTPTAKSCINCEENGIYTMHHDDKLCKKINFLDLRTKLEQKI